MANSPLITELIDAFCCLPGVGQKSAQRMAYHLLERDREGAVRLARALEDASAKVGHCTQCRTFSEDEICTICANSQRDRSQLCIVETPVDAHAIEQATGFRGVYFVLMGHLSPLDGIGPEDIGLDVLGKRFDEGEIKEVIIATNPTVEGEATAHYINDMAHKRNLSVSRIAHGVPLGGELEFVDNQTLLHAFSGRRAM